jgi:hypothetical protein
MTALGADGQERLFDNSKTVLTMAIHIFQTANFAISKRWKQPVEVNVSSNI